MCECECECVDEVINDLQGHYPIRIPPPEATRLLSHQSAGEPQTPFTKAQRFDHDSFSLDELWASGA